MSQPEFSFQLSPREPHQARVQAERLREAGIRAGGSPGVAVAARGFSAEAAPGEALRGPGQRRLPAGGTWVISVERVGNTRLS